MISSINAWYADARQYIVAQVATPNSPGVNFYTRELIASLRSPGVVFVAPLLPKNAKAFRLYRVDGYVQDTLQY